MEYFIEQERLCKTEYMEFLKKSDLGSQYPKERFDDRIEALLKNASISLTARKPSRELIGVCLGITDFAYWLFLTDLGIVREHCGKGIGSALIKKAHDIAGGEKDIVMYLCANDDAVGFYEKLGMKTAKHIMVYDKIEWTDFTVK